MAIYISIPDIKGPCKKAGHEGWIELESVSWGVNRQSDSAQQGGLVSGVPKMEYVSYTSKSCAGSAMLFQYMVQGKHNAEIVVHATKNVGTAEPEAWWKLTLTDAIITQVNQDLEPDEARDHVTIAFGMYEIDIGDQLADGSLDSPTTTMYDVRTAS